MENDETAARLGALERRLVALEQRVGAEQSAVESGQPAVESGGGGRSDDAAGPAGTDGSGGRLVVGSGSTDGEETFWILNGLRSRLGEAGGVAFAGSVQVPDGPVEWQFGATSEDVLSSDWSVLAPDLAALGHPARLTLLQAILGGAHTVTELSAVDGIGSTGQLYHHLGQLSGHGWLNTVARGRYVVPAPRIVPLMVIMTATRRIG